MEGQTSHKVQEICRGCLEATSLVNIENTFFNEKSALIFYAEVCKVETQDIIPVLMCSSCTQQLETSHLFISKLRKSNAVFKQVINEINTGTNDIKCLLKDILDKDVEAKQETCEEEVDLSFSQQQKNVDSDSTDDEVPLSKRFDVSNKKAWKQNVQNIISELTDLTETCPLCDKKYKSMTKHITTIHKIDMQKSKCLKCFYQTDNKDRLLEHGKHCAELKEESEEENQFSNWENHDSEEEFDGGVGSEFPCNKCSGISYIQYKDIEAHLKKIHNEETCCIICDHSFTNHFSLIYHMMIKHGKLKFTCRLCLVSFTKPEELQAHYKSEEHNTKCTVCGEQLKNRKAVYEHRRKKHLNPQQQNISFKCPECFKEFANKNNIRRHVMSAHNDLRFLCDHCGQSYTTKRNLRLHILKFHEGVAVESKKDKKNFFCDACGKELKIFHKYAIAMHRAKHKGHRHVCRKCYESFASEEEFEQHVTDAGHYLYKCDKCPSEFVREEYLKLHVKNHDVPGWNKNMFASWGKSAQLRNEKGEFVCSYCPKVFINKQRLDNHVRVHTNERPYKCHICSKGFKTWIHRKTHLNIHLGIKKWVCKFCTKAFTNSCSVKAHEMIHTGERPHRCSECKKGFITMSAMKKHRMVHFRNTGYKKVKVDVEQVDFDGFVEHKQEIVGVLGGDLC